MPKFLFTKPTEAVIYKKLVDFLILTSKGRQFGPENRAGEGTGKTTVGQKQ